MLILGIFVLLNISGKWYMEDLHALGSIRQWDPKFVFSQVSEMSDSMKCQRSVHRVYYAMYIDMQVVHKILNH